MMCIEVFRSSPCDCVDLKRLNILIGHIQPECVLTMGLSLPGLSLLNALFSADDVTACAKAERNQPAAV